MKIESYIRKIINDGDKHEMEELSDILVDVVNVIKKYDEDCYREYKMKIYKMAYGNKITEEVAQDIVKNMKPYGQRWSINETEQMQKDYGLDDINFVNFYLVINMSYNDYRNVFEDNLETYIKFSEAFIRDIDSKPNKILNYFL